MCSLSGREWGHAQGERQCQEHKRGSKNIGINRVFTLFFHGYFSSNSLMTPFGRRGELITSYRSLTTKVNSYMRSHNIQLAHFNKATFPYLDLAVIVPSQSKHILVTAPLRAVWGEGVDLDEIVA